MLVLPHRSVSAAWLRLFEFVWRVWWVLRTNSCGIFRFRPIQSQQIIIQDNFKCCESTASNSHYSPINCCCSIAVICNKQIHKRDWSDSIRAIAERYCWAAPNIRHSRFCRSAAEQYVCTFYIVTTASTMYFQKYCLIVCYFVYLDIAICIPVHPNPPIHPLRQCRFYFDLLVSIWDAAVAFGVLATDSGQNHPLFEPKQKRRVPKRY